jgi:signal transduction histidine kinase
MRAKRRTLRAYLVEPFKQIRFGLHVVSVSFAFIALLGWLFVRAFREQYQQVIDIFQVTETADLMANDVFLRNALIIGGTLAMFAASMMFVVIRRTHKMYGPMVSILRFVGELERGNYAVRIHVRERDDFQNLVGRLNSLAETMHGRYGLAVSGDRAGLDALDARLRDIEEGVVVVTDARDSGNKAS